MFLQFLLLPLMPFLPKYLRSPFFFLPLEDFRMPFSSPPINCFSSSFKCLASPSPVPVPQSPFPRSLGTLPSQVLLRSSYFLRLPQSSPLFSFLDFDSPFFVVERYSTLPFLFIPLVSQMPLHPSLLWSGR